MRKLLRLAFLIFAVTSAFRLGRNWDENASLPHNLARLYAQSSLIDTNNQSLQHRAKETIGSLIEPLVEQMGGYEEAESFLQQCVQNFCCAAEDRLRDTTIADLADSLTDE